MHLESLKNLEAALSNDSNNENNDFNFLNNMNEALANLRSEQAMSQLNSTQQNSISQKILKISGNPNESEISKLFHNNKSIYNSSKIFPATRNELAEESEVGSFWDLTQDKEKSKDVGKLDVMFDVKGDLKQIGAKEEVSSAKDPGEGRNSRIDKDDKMCASLVGVPFREKSSTAKRSTVRNSQKNKIKVRLFSFRYLFFNF